MSQQKVLVLVGDAAEELDAMYPIYRLREAGYIADVAALTRRDVQLVIHDFDPNSDAYTEKNGRKLPVDIAFFVRMGGALKCFYPSPAGPTESLNVAVAGAIALGLTLLYWLTESTRIYDRDLGVRTATDLPVVVREGPPPGVQASRVFWACS